tara:strand:+ start:181 stop:522 length:342 start_codon:yes stop_codon:yes gene_type:complete
MNPEPFKKSFWFDKYKEFEDMKEGGMPHKDLTSLLASWNKEYEEYKKTPEYLKEKMKEMERAYSAIEANYDELERELELCAGYERECDRLEKEIKLLKRPLWKKIWDKICSNL